VGQDFTFTFLYKVKSISAGETADIELALLSLSIIVTAIIGHLAVKYSWKIVDIIKKCKSALYTLSFL